jgi:hypothetical protein
MNPPLLFSALAQRAASPGAGGYPYQIRGSDLDKNFVYATEDFDGEHFEVTDQPGSNGHMKRKIRLLAPVKAGETVDQYLKWDGSAWVPTDKFPKRKILIT